MDSWVWLALLSTLSGFGLLGWLAVGRQGVPLEELLSSRDQLGTGLGIATAVASVAGAWILFGPAETVTWAGLPGLLGYAVGQAVPLVAIAILGQRLRRLMPQGHSLTEYVWHRYGAGMTRLTLAIALFYMVVFLIAELTGIATAVQLLGGIPLAVTATLVMTATLLYTARGGLWATIITDGVQFAVIVPLLLLMLVLALQNAGDPKAIPPLLLDWGHVPGWQFAATLVIAITAANLFHQGFWQRVYACKNERVLWRSFGGAALVVVPLIAIAGVLGFVAVGLGLAEGAESVAVFALVNAVFPRWGVLLVLVLGLALVMSSLDTLLTGISSLLTTELNRWGVAQSRLMGLSRGVIVAVSIPTIIIAAQGYSVLYLFLLADLVCAGAMVPVFAGLYSARLTGSGALIASVVGILVGALFFPLPNFSPWLAIPGGGNFLVSFGSALIMSTLLTVIAHASKSRFDFAILRDRVQPFT